MQRADVRAMCVGDGLAADRAAAERAAELVAGFVESEDRVEPLPDRIARFIPAELVGIDESARRDRADHRPRHEAVAGRQSEVSRRFPTAAAGVVERRLGIVGQRETILGLVAAVVERHDRREASIEGSGDSGRIAASGDRAEQNEFAWIDARSPRDERRAGHDVADHPTHQAFADERQLHPRVVPKVVVLPRRTILTRVLLLGGERVRPSFAVTELVHHQHDRAAPRERHPHPLQFALRLRRVMAVDDQDARHFFPRGSRRVDVGRDPHAGARLKRDVLDPIAVAVDSTGRVKRARLSRQGIERERTSQMREPHVAKRFPIGPRLHGVPSRRVPPIGGL